MGRLHCVILISPDLERQKAFYEQKLGLTVSHATSDWVSFGMRGAAVTLRSAPTGTPAQLHLAITAVPLEPRLAALKARQAPLEDALEDTPVGRMALIRDPEGNPVRLLEPREPGPAGNWPRLSHAIIDATEFAATAHFYRDVLGLRVAAEHEGWIEFDTGDTRLTLHDRDRAGSLPLHPDQRVTFALEDEDLEAWAEELRKRGVSFAAAPMEDALGLQAEVEDADGWFVVLRGPVPEVPFEESLAEEFEDDDDGDESRASALRRLGEVTNETPRKRTTPAKQARRAAERTQKSAFENLTRPREEERTGFPPRPFPPRPAGEGRPFPPRPAGEGRPFPPRPPRPGAPPGSAPRGGGPPGARPGGPPRPGRPPRP